MDASTTDGTAGVAGNPAADFLDETQWKVLSALVDGALPSLVAKSANSDKTAQVTIADDEFNRALKRAIAMLPDTATEASLKEFLAYRPSQDPRYVDNVCRTFASGSSAQLKKLAGVLTTLSSRPGSLLLTGHWQPLYNQPAAVREAVLKSWASSRLGPLRGLTKSIATVTQKASCQSLPQFHQLVGYPDIPKNRTVGQGFDLTFLQFEPGADAHVLETDVVIVGSGCGGGVSAKNLAEAGHKVLIVDKGYYFHPEQLPMNQEDGCAHLFDNGGVYTSEDNGMSIIAGSVWGGGGTVNWSVCLKLQDYVRKEWAGEGLPFFTSAAFDESCDRVLEFIGAGTGGIRHNHRNRVVVNGSKRLGWAAKDAPQNTGGKEHSCGHCHLGCSASEKKGPAVSWLPAAAEAGAQFMEGFQVDRVLFGEDGSTAVGVEGQWTSRDSSGGVSGPESERSKRRVVIKAKKVILSAGSLWTPLLLLKSGLENHHIGSNLHLHPCNMVTGVYDEEIRPWEGGIITSYCSEFENLDQGGHGVKLEPTCMIPYTCLSMIPWTGGLDAKLQMLTYSHQNGFISLTRDRDSGRVFPDPKTGRPRIAYTVSDFDRDHTLEGVQALAKLCYVTGAREIRPLLPGLEPFVSSQQLKLDDPATPGETKDPEFSDPAFASWLGRLREVGNKPPLALFTSAHQMGTCRMSRSQADGVVDEKGRVWGKQNLYIADASVFPSASGVNPMITVMTIADWISRGVGEELRASE